MASAAEQLAANLNFSAFSKATELKQRIWFTLGALIVYRLGTYIPKPGIDASALQSFFGQQGSLFDMLNMLAGGAVGRMAIFALNIMPYVTASIIVQLMTTVSPTLEKLKKEGEQGRKQINQYTRYGTVILAAVLLKMGGYGFVRFSLPIAPDASGELAWLMITLSLVAVVYIGFVALVQQDMKKLIAYSSIAHMGFATLGFFLTFTILENTGSLQGSALGMEGGMVQMISHGFISGALFLCVGVLYDRVHSRRIADYGGVVNTMPVFATFMVLFAMANAGLPGTSGFIGEFTVILASFKANFWFAFLAATTLILGAAYSLWLVKRVMFGEVANPNVAALKDIGAREAFVLGAFALATLALVENQQYIHYNKGSLVFYALRDYIGSPLLMRT